MYRVIKSSIAINYDDAADQDVLSIIGRRNYDKLYKTATSRVDDEIWNQYGDSNVEYQNAGCEMWYNDGMYTILSKIDAEFTSDSGKRKFCHAELETTFDKSRNKLYDDTTVTYFDDNVPYE